MEKKNVNVSAKVTEQTHEDAKKALARTGTKTISRFIQGCLESMIKHHKSGDRIAEPVQLLTESQRRILERQ